MFRKWALWPIFLHLFLLSACHENPRKAERSPQSQLQWFRGNTHTHTKISGHGDATPEEVVNWYHSHGYNFLVLSEHNHFIDPEKVEMPTPLRNDFILVPGLELTGAKHIHTTALNVRQVVPFDFDSPKVHEIVQNHTDLILDMGGKPIINHPNFVWALGSGDIIKVERAFMMELFNGHPHVHNQGDEQHISTERIWDKILSTGKKMYAVASDDAHHFHTFKNELSNPGRGWIMVKAKSLSVENIMEALSEGQFYASNGVFLKDIGLSNDEELFVEVDLDKTQQNLAEFHSIENLKNIKILATSIDFLGPKMTVLQKFKHDKAKYNLKELKESFVRARVTVKYQVNGVVRKVKAWGQPVFTHN